MVRYFLEERQKVQGLVLIPTATVWTKTKQKTILTIFAKLRYFWKKRQKVLGFV
jgi:hypothetical protein